MAKTKAERLEALRQQELALKARRQALEASLSQEERKRDTRRKILAGAVALAHAAHDPAFAAALRAALDAALSKDADRDLFQDWLTVAKESHAENQPPPASASFIPAPPTEINNTNES